MIVYGIDDNNCIKFINNEWLVIINNELIYSSNILIQALAMYNKFY